MLLREERKVELVSRLRRAGFAEAALSLHQHNKFAPEQKVDVFGVLNAWLDEAKSASLLADLNDLRDALDEDIRAAPER